MNRHTLSVYPEEYEDLKTGRKRFVIVPRNDDYKVGDYMVIHKVDRYTKQVSDFFYKEISGIQADSGMFMGNPELWMILFLKFNQIIYTDRT